MNANKGILGILGNCKPSSTGYRMLHYCVSTPVADGTLLLNVLTRELLLLTPEEFENVTELPYLRKHWFVVPEETDEKKLADMVRWVQKTMRKETDHFNRYTILTTTDCNARCFYCYELGRTRVPMSPETALKTAAFIRKHCDGKEVLIQWFGGEPLYNVPVIDLICRELHTYGVKFRSIMVSNGYLFDDDIIERAATQWNLKQVQITLDGTEAVYNRCKAYIYREGSPYQVVTGNIGKLLDKGIGISVRMNMDFHNAQDLLALSDELAQRFAGKTGLQAYAPLIFDENKTRGQRYTPEKWAQLYDAQRQLEEKLISLGLLNTASIRLNPKLKESHCMADCGTAVVIAPDGHVGVCEHFSESEFIGHIDSDEFNRDLRRSWQEQCDAIPECKTCFHYPMCVELKKCPDRMECIQPERLSRLRRTVRAMENEYRRWLQGCSAEDEFEDLDQC